MEEKLKKFNGWSALVKDIKLTRWEALPDIELYMDQVITYIEKQLQAFSDEETKLITPSMINNYVKDGVIAHPVQKRYFKEHLAALIMIGVLKQVLPLSQLKKLTGILSEAGEKKNIYDFFIETQEESLKLIIDKVKDTKEDTNSEKLLFTALKLSCEAFANQIAAERIFKMIEGNNNKEETGEKENTEKAKKKETKKSKKEIKEKT